MKSSLRILMTTDAMGGAWNYSIELASALVNNGCEVALARMGKLLKTQQLKDISRTYNITIFQSSFKPEWMDDPGQDVNESIDWLQGIINEFKPDLLHLNTFAHGSIKSSIPTVLVAHSCVLSWWKSVKKANAPEAYKIYKRRVEESLNSANVVVAPSYSMLKSIKANYRMDKEIKVIYNGRNPLNYRRGNKEELILTSGGLWDEAKNVASLVKMSDKISWPILLAGDKYHPVTGKTVPLENVTFLGKLSQREMSDYFARASIYVLPARYEPFGLSILEAGLSGCAIIGGNIDSLHEIWEDNILYVDPEDPEELLSTVNRLISDINLLQDYAQKSYEHAQHFNAYKMGESYLSLYRMLPVIMEVVL